MDYPSKLPTVLSLCTGYGGIERGLELAGFAHRVVAHVEIEAFAVANLVAKMEAGQLVPAPIWTDLKTLPVDCFRDRVDLLTSGYPCQPFSNAGKRQGEDDPRHLWPHIKRHIETIRPVQCFFENVEGHISLGLREVIEDLESLGYSTTWGVFSAAEVGAPHQRKRVYVLGDSKHDGLSATEVFGSSASPSDNDTQRQKSSIKFEGASEPRNDEDVAHPNSAGQQPSEGQLGSPEARHNAGRSGEAVADTGSKSRRGRQIHPRARNKGRQASEAGGEGLSPEDGQALADHAQSGSEDVPNANLPRLQGRLQRGRANQEGRQEQALRRAAQRGDQRSGDGRDSQRSASIGGLGRGFDGPASWLDGSWELGVPRVTNDQNYRVDRLRLIGNGVVPQTAAKAWIVLNNELR